jgi:hypothetical protein
MAKMVCSVSIYQVMEESSSYQPFWALHNENGYSALTFSAYRHCFNKCFVIIKPGDNWYWSLNKVISGNDIEQKLQTLKTDASTSTLIKNYHAKLKQLKLAY